MPSPTLPRTVATRPLPLIHSVRAALPHLAPALLGALVLSTVTFTVPDLIPSAQAQTTTPYRPVAQALRPELETLRQQEAIKLYGSPDIKPVDQRKSAITTMGDSQISGEGANDRGLYEPGTDGPTNWCHRSSVNAIKVTPIQADVRANLSCSGAQSLHMKYGGEKMYGEENQGDKLAVLARNTRVRMIWLNVGANDMGGLEFGPTMTECTENRIWLRGPCWSKHSESAQRRVNSIQRTVTEGIGHIRDVMRNAGYADSDYQLMLVGYPSPVSPDVEDNPRFPGWYAGGCTLYLHDAGIGRNKVVPMFNEALRAAARATGVRWVDQRFLFHGHEVCTSAAWVTGVTNMGDPFKGNDWRQSWHPAPAGHQAFAFCMAKAINSNARESTCVEPYGRTPEAVQYYPQALQSYTLRFGGSNLCMDLMSNNTRIGTAINLWNCHGGINQSFIYDPSAGSIHSEMAYNRCIEASPDPRAGSTVYIAGCNGADHQRWTIDGALVRNRKNPAVCLAAPTDSVRAGLGNQVVLQNCNPSDRKQQVSPLIPQQINAYQVKNSAGLCLDVPNGALGTGSAQNLTANACNKSLAQTWRYDFTRQTVVNYFADHCMDVGVAQPGTLVRVITCNVQQEPQYQGNGHVVYENGYLYRADNPQLVITSATTPGQALTLQPRSAALAARQNWAPTGQLSDTRVGYGYNDWISSSMY